MDRRSFLSAIGLTAATAVLDPERLLWVPGAKKIFIPPAPKYFVSVDYCKDSAHAMYWIQSNGILWVIDELQARALTKKLPMLDGRTLTTELSREEFRDRYPDAQT